MKISSRFILDNLFVIAGAFLVAAALAFTAPVAGWTGFGVFTGLTVIAGVSAALARNPGRKAGHGLVAVAGLWSLIAALVFSGTVLMWLVLADAILVGVLALADLTAHEVTTEKVVHQLVVTGTPGNDTITLGIFHWAQPFFADGVSFFGADFFAGWDAALAPDEALRAGAALLGGRAAAFFAAVTSTSSRLGPRRGRDRSRALGQDRPRHPTGG